MPATERLKRIVDGVREPYAGGRRGGILVTLP